MKKTVSLLLAILLLAAALCSCGTGTISLDKTEIVMIVGSSTKLSAGKTARVNWSSSDEAVATVSAGTVSAKSAGTAVITASLESGEKAECQITVIDKLITAITLDTSSARVEPGKTIQITATFKPADASDKKLIWSSDNEAVASVDDRGYVTAVAEGTAIITCRSENGVAASCTILVGGLQIPTVAPAPATQKPTQAVKPSETAPVGSTTAGTEPVTPSSGGSSGGFVFSDSSSRYLTKDEIRDVLGAKEGSPVSQSFAQDAVNEIFARHGYVFSTPELRAYYEAQSWYHADPGYDGSLSDIEIYNIAQLSGY